MINFFSSKNGHLTLEETSVHSKMGCIFRSFALLHEEDKSEDNTLKVRNNG
jgi:hypothetical protein